MMIFTSGVNMVQTIRGRPIDYGSTERSEHVFDEWQWIQAQGEDERSWV